MMRIAAAGQLASVLAPEYRSAFDRIKSEFAAAGDGMAAIRARTDLVNSLVTRLYAELISSQPGGPAGFCLAATGGFGRQELFPFSDIDLLFIAKDERGLESQRESIAALLQGLWDMRLRVGHSARTLADCGRLHQGNVEFSISLLDVRHLAGDQELFDILHSRTIPHLAARDRQDLLRNLIDAMDRRHAKHERTIFHLEPDIKDAPGGLRDYHTARWLLALRALAERQGWAEIWPNELEQKTAPAALFLTTLRCFVHFERGRNDNALSYELQERAAALGLGVRYGTAVDPNRWMGQYYLHVRMLHAVTAELIRRTQPERSGLYSLFQDRTSRLSNSDFSVIRGRIFPRSPARGELAPLLLVFEMLARSGLELSSEAESWAEAAVKAFAAGHATNAGAAVWAGLRRIVALPRAADALRAMHRLGVLTALLPEFHAIDGLVIRDFYHRYTVDEHSFMAIQHLCELAQARRGAAREPEEGGVWERKLSEIASEIERPDLLRFALLLHDIGKGMDVPSHIAGSLEALESVCARLGVMAEDAETLRFLIGQHLEISSTLARRDIFDASTARALARKTGSPERLKMLCLFTYADIKAVSPEALTPWKTELLWQLYAMTMNDLARSADQERVISASEEKAPIIPGVPDGSDEARELETFLDGFPRRYIAAHSPEEIADHFRAARELKGGGVRSRVRRREHAYELTVLASDRPFLFSSIAGALAGWGMNILKAEAFANRAGTVLDVFRFEDPFRTLELNPSEIARLESAAAAVIRGETSVASLLGGRAGSKRVPHAKVEVPTQVIFDDISSSRCTLLEVITQDRPGLLYAIGSALAELGCNIEIALVDTEAGKAIDVFYLTAHGGKLNADRQEAIRRTLLKEALAAH